MAIDPPYRLDPLQNVVNVKWGGPPLISHSWQFFATWEGSGVYDCPLGPGSLGQSTTSFTVALEPTPDPPGFMVSGAPSGGGTVSGGAGAYAALAFIEDSQSGTGPGSATFEVNGLMCSTSVPPPNQIAGTISVTIPVITMTDIEGTGAGDIYELIHWTASATAGILVAATFELMATA